MSSEEKVAVAVIAICLLKKRKKRKKIKRSIWVKPWLSRRNKLGLDNTLLNEFRNENRDEYKKFLRMSPENFDELLNLILPSIQKSDTRFREAIPAKIKLAITLRFLSTGETYVDLQHQFRVHKSTISQFIPAVCEALYEKLKDTYLKVSFLCIFFS